MKPLLLITSLMLTASLAHAGASKKKEQGRERGEKMRQELGLSDEQLAKVKAIREKSKDDHKAQREKLKVARENLHTAMGNPKATKDELMTKFTEVEKLQSEAHRARFATMLSIREVLNEEQIKKFHEKKGRWREKFKERRSHQRKGPPPHEGDDEDEE